MISSDFHLPVLLEEVTEGLRWDSKSKPSILDLTVGAGGHLGHLLNTFGAPGKITAVDQDPSALALARKHLEKFSSIHWVHSNFSDFVSQTSETFDRITVDLGVSSMQLDDADRGFSFRANGPLDMRMNPTKGQTAAEWIMHCGEEEFKKVLYDGEESRARWYAAKLIEVRKTRAITTTEDFVRAFGYELTTKNHLGKHPMTKVFQAIRIFINREFEVLEILLEHLPRILNPDGKAAIITFHSIEDRMVKWALRDRLSAINKKVIIASEEELSTNPRSRSAKLRLFSKS